MPIAANTGTRDVSLKFASALTNVVNSKWDSGEFLSRTSLITQ